MGRMAGFEAQRCIQSCWRWFWLASRLALRFPSRSGCLVEKSTGCVRRRNVGSNQQPVHVEELLGLIGSLPVAEAITVENHCWSLSTTVKNYENWLLTSINNYYQQPSANTIMIKNRCWWAEKLFGCPFSASSQRGQLLLRWDCDSSLAPWHGSNGTLLNGG